MAGATSSSPLAISTPPNLFPKASWKAAVARRLSRSMRWALVTSVDRTDVGGCFPAQRGSASRAREVPPWLCGAGGGRTACEKSSLDAFSDARGGIVSELLLDAAGRRRSPATLPHFHAGRPPRNKGIRYPADPPTVEEIIAVMRTAGDAVHGRRLRGLIVVLWRARLRIHEALALTEADLDARRGSLLVRRGKGGRRREVGIVRRRFAPHQLRHAMPLRWRARACR
jgi:hypothetical protein